MNRALAAGLLAVLVLTGCGDDNSIYSQLTLDWFSPGCEAVRGFPVATLSTDGGVTIRPTAPHSGGWALPTAGLAAASAHGGLLFARRSPHVYYSTDAGCSWQRTARIEGGVEHLVASDRYGYFVSSRPANYDTLNRIAIDGSILSYELPFWVRDIATTPADASALYVLSHDEKIYRSDDLGRTLVVQGTAPPFPDTPEHLYINPRDSLHFFVTGLDQPGVSFDGGVTWTESRGILADASSAVTFQAAFGGAGQGELWVMGGRHYRNTEGNIVRDEDGLFRSLDGGLTFERVLVNGERIKIGNGGTIATAPGVFGEIVLAHRRGGDDPAPGTIVYRVSDDSLTPRYYPGESACGIYALLFHPVDADVLYVGKTPPDCSVTNY